jgi:hypothetical protein
LQSIHTPFPVFSLEIKAAMIAPWAYRPVAMSVLATPTYRVVMGCFNSLAVVRTNLAWRAIRFTGASRKR